MNFFEREYEQYRVIPSDINENLHYLHELALKCDHVTEMGVRTGISTRAFLNTNATLISYDFEYNSDVAMLFLKADEHEKKAKYIIADVRTVEIEETDLLFIDTWHCYEQLKIELALHHKNVRKYIAFHDTYTYGLIAEDNYNEKSPSGLGLLPAIVEFMNENPQWKFKMNVTNNNGLMILEKQNDVKVVEPIEDKVEVYDCFPFFNEKELFELRVNILKNYVDGFIVLEANYTHSGQPKPYTCKTLIKELGFEDLNINVVEVDLSQFQNETDAWVRERYQRNFLNDVVKNYSDNSLFIVGDCDEILNPFFLNDYVNKIQQNNDNLYKIPMNILCSRADLCIANETTNELHRWEASFVAHKKLLLLNTIEDLRWHIQGNHLMQNEERTITGWHFTWMGDGNRRLEKITSFAHHKDFCNYSTIPNWESNEMKQHLLSFKPQNDGQEPLLRQGIKLVKYDVENLPKEIFKLQHIKNYLLPEIKNSIPIIGVPIVNGVHWLKRLIESIDYPVNELCVINNNGRGELDYELFRLTQVKHDFIGKITICTLPSNIGCSGAWNLIIKSYILKPYWIICNNDIAFTPGFLEQMALKAQNESVGMVFGQHQEWSLFLIKDWVVQKCGLFDENLYPAYCEDADYSIRIKHLEIPCDNVSLPYLHGDKGYEESGSQTWRLEDGLYAKIRVSHDLNHEYMAEKWGQDWKDKYWDCIPYKHPFNDERMPMSITTYDLEFQRKKHLGF